MLINGLTNIISFKQLKPAHWALIFAAFIIIHIPSVLNYHGENLYSSMARSFLEGRLSIPPETIPEAPGTDAKMDGDMITYHGKYYSAYPPAPALLLLPFIAIFGHVNPILIAVLLTCLNIYLLYSIFNKLKIKEWLIPWLIYGFIFGTGYWFVLLTSHHMYGFAQVVSLTLVFLFLNELFGRNRAGLLGLFLGISFLCRQFTIILFVFGMGYLIHCYLTGADKKSRKIFWRKAAVFGGILGCSVLVALWYNDARFGNPLDTGYSYMNYIGIYKYRVGEYGVFSIHYVLINIYNYLLRGFDIEFTGNGLMQIKGMDLFGSAFLMASPFLVAAFKTGWHKWLRISSWVTIGMIFTGLLFYHSNGREQVNTSRYALDFLPIMLILAGFGADKLPKWLFKAMVIYAILINILAYAIHFKFHTLQKYEI